MKKQFKFIGLVFCALFLMQIFGAYITTAYAARGGVEDITGTVDIITGVELTDISDNPLGTDVAKNAQFRLTYLFSIPSASGISVGEELWFDLPDEVTVFTELSAEIYDTDPPFDRLFTATIFPSNEIRLIFEDEANNAAHGFVGEFWFEMAFNASEIGNSSPVNIEFDSGRAGDPYGVDVDFVQDPPPAATAVKSSTYNAATKEITWTLTVDSENVSMGDIQVSDALTAGHEFVPGSLTLGGSAVDVADYTYNATTRTLLYTSPSAVSTEQIFQFRTLVSDSSFLSETSSDLTISNKADVITPTGTIPSNTVSETIPINLMDKPDGVYDGATKTVDWTVVVNEEEVQIDNASVQDVLPAGLALDPASIVYTYTDAITPSHSTSSVGPDGDGLYTETIDFNLGNITEQVTITYTTTIDNEVFLSQDNNSMTNTAVLSGTGVVANNSDTGVGPVDNVILEKAGDGYTISTGIISWELTVNPEQVSLDNVVVTDVLPTSGSRDLDYITGTFAISPAVAGGAFNYDPGTETITYTFPANITSTYTITYDTQIVDPALYKTNDDPTFTNTASITADNAVGGDATGSQRIYSDVLQKSGRGYDYSTKTFTWRIRVNNNYNDLSGVVVSDYIPEGQEYVPGSERIVYYGGANNGNAFTDGSFTYTPYSPSITHPIQSWRGDVTGLLQYTFNNPTSERFYIYYETTNTDYTSLEENKLNLSSSSERIRVYNHAYLDHDDITSTVSHSAGYNITSSVVEKDSNYTDGNDYIDWEVMINRNEITLGSIADPPILSDTLQQGLYLDTGSIELYNLTVNSDSSTTLGSQVVIDPSQISYDVNTRIFAFDFQDEITTAYRLTFRTYIEDRTQAPFTNDATFDMVSSNETSEEENVSSNFFAAGGYANGSVGRLVLTKYDVNHTADLLQGAVFELYDSDGNTIDSQTTDSNGELIFDFIFYDRDYTYREITPPTNYIGDTTTVYTLRINSADVTADATARSVEVYISNEEIRGNIEFTKVDDETVPNPLPGAEFELFEDDGVTSTGLTYISQADGTVTFTNLLPGDYLIREITAPTNFQLLTSDIPVTVPQANSTQTYYPATNPVTNIEHTFITTGKGRIYITKVDEDYPSTLLAGAVFELTNTTRSETVTGTTDAVGEVMFDDIYFDEDYTLTEITAPTFYQLNPTVYNFRIDSASVDVADDETRIIRQTVTNKMITGSITFTKYTESYERLAGATFALYNAVGTEVATAVSQADGTVLFDDIIPGTYTIKETIPPSSYHASTEVLTATIPMGGAAVISTPDFVINEHIDGTIVVNVESDHDLTGRRFKIGIFNSARKLVYTITYTNDHPIVIKDVPYGHYTASILSNGYGYTGETVIVSLTEINGMIHLTLYLNINPNTDDGTNYLMYILFAVGVLMILGGAGYYFRRRRKINIEG